MTKKTYVTTIVFFCDKNILNFKFVLSFIKILKGLGGVKFLNIRELYKEDSMIFTQNIDFKKSITFKVEIAIIIGWVLIHFLGIDKQYLTGSMEDVWSGKYWLPLTDWLTTSNLYMQLGFLYGFSFFGLKAEQRLGSKNYLTFILCAHSISVLLSLIMFQNLGGGLSGVVWSLIVLYLLPAKYQIKRGVLWRFFIFFMSFQLFSVFLASYSINEQVPHLVQCTLGVFSTLLFLVLGKVKVPKFEYKALTGFSIFLWLITIYNPFHYLWDIAQLDGDESQRSQQIEEFLQSAEGRTKIELAWRVLKGEFKGVDKKLALDLLEKNEPGDFYTALVLSDYYLGRHDSTAQNDSMALKYLSVLPTVQLPNSANSLATILCGSVDSTLHDVEKGLELAEEFNESSQWKNPAYIDTYAACLSNQGKYKEASQWLSRAMLITDSTETELIKELKSNLERVDKGHPITYPLLPIKAVVAPLDTLVRKLDTTMTSVIDTTLTPGDSLESIGS